MRFLKPIFTHSIFVGLCAAALALHSQLLFFHKANPNLVAFVFSSTLAAYNIYWVFSKFANNNPPRLRHFLLQNWAYLIIAAVSILVSMVMLAKLADYLPYIAFSIVLTGTYMSLACLPNLRARFRSIGFVKTILLASTWTFITVIIPIVPHLGQRTSAAFTMWSLFVNRFLLMFILCVIFDKKNIEGDKEKDVYTIATGLSPAILNKVMQVTFVLFFVAGAIAKFTAQGWPGIFGFILMYSVVFYVYLLSNRSRGYYFYYFLVDGLMLLPLFTYLLMEIL